MAGCIRGQFNDVGLIALHVTFFMSGERQTIKYIYKVVYFEMMYTILIICNFVVIT